MPELAIGRYFCPDCPERFLTTGDKKRHMRTEHPREENADAE